MFAKDLEWNASPGSSSRSSKNNNNNRSLVVHSTEGGSARAAGFSFIDNKDMGSPFGACLSFCRHNGGDMKVPVDSTTTRFQLPAQVVDNDRTMTDAELAKSLHELSAQDRNSLYEDIHGVAPVAAEDPELVTRRLNQLEDEIERVKDDKSAYSKALFLAPRLVKSREFRLMFLRATNYDPRQSARRIVQHFRDKARLFGEGKVGKTITLEDLNEDDMAALQSGAEQFLPVPDRAGRAVAVQARKHLKPKTWENQLRAHWYTFMTNIQNNKHIQKNGVVYVVYDVDCTLAEGIKNMDHAKNMCMIKEGLPFKLVSLQFCYNDAIIDQLIGPLRRICGTDMTLRAREHFGTHQECRYHLMSFGIPISIFPVDMKGEMRGNFIREFIESRKAKERELKDKEANTNQVDAATDSDILLGRGRPSQNHAGNVQLAKLIEERHPIYSKADRFEKLCISWDIVKLVQNDIGGRFLEKDGSSGAWKQVADDQARDKVAYGFRSVRKLRTK